MRILSVVVILFVQFHCLLSSAKTPDTVCNNLIVIDGRGSKDDIRWVGAGFIDDRILGTKMPFTTRFETIYDAVKADRDTYDDELVVVLYYVSAVDRAGEGDAGIGTFAFSADFFQGHNGQYWFIDNVDPFYEIVKPRHVKDSLIAMANNKIYSTLVKYSVKGIRRKGKQPYTLEQAANRRRVEALKYPVYNTTRLRTGIFYTCDQFLDNAPVDTPFIKWTSAIGEDNVTSFFYKNSKGKRGEKIADTDFFAIHDGKDIWVSDFFSARRMTYENGDFYAKKLFVHYYDVVDGTIIPYLWLDVVGGAGADEIHTRDKSKCMLYKTRFDPISRSFVPIGWIK